MIDLVLSTQKKVLMFIIVDETKKISKYVNNIHVSVGVK